MKILYVIASMNIGGAEKHLLTVASHFASKEGNKIYVFAFNSDGPLKQKFEEKKITVIGMNQKDKINSLSYLRRLKNLVDSSGKLWKFIWKIRPKIIHFYLPQAYIIGALVSFFCPVGVRIMSRRSLNDYQKKFKMIKYLEIFLHKKMDRIVANSNAVLEQLNKDEKVPLSKLTLIYNGVDTRIYNLRNSSIRTELGIAENELVFVKIANLIPYKGHLDLIEACNIVKEKISYKWRVLLVGRDEGIGQMLKEKVNDFQLNRNFIFLNSRIDIPDVLSISNIGILCSHQEGFSNAILEMMAAGLPTIVTDVGGNSEAIIDGYCGTVVPAYNPMKLAEAILDMVYHQNRTDIGKHAYERVNHAFSLAACIKGYEGLYEEFL